MYLPILWMRKQRHRIVTTCLGQSVTAGLIFKALFSSAKVVRGLT